MYSVASIARNCIRYNRSNNYGGGIYIDGPVKYEGVKIENNYVNANMATYNGSGIYTFSSGDQQNALVIDYNTITNNTSGSGGLYINQPSQITVINNIVYSNTGGIMKSGSTVTVVRNCVYNNGTDYSSGVIHNSDINQSPQLGAWYYLNSNSPCIDNADPSYITSIDIDGRTRPRPTSGAYDIGCYEY